MVIGMKHIRKDPRTNHYQIIKEYRVNGKRITNHFGSFKDLNQAKEYRDKCIENNWDKQLMPKNNPTTINPLKYITKTPAGNYRIQKWENGNSICYGTYTTLFDAMQERDLLIKYNWDYDAVCNIDETIVGMPIFKGRRMDENG